MFEIIVIVIIIIIYKCSVNTPSSKAFKESIYRDQYEWLLEYSCEQFDKLGVNDTLRMYKNDDIRMYNFDCITDTIVEVITTCNTYTLLTVHLL